MVNNIVPYGINNIINELVKRNYLIPLEDMRNRKYYKDREKDMGWVKWGLWKMYTATVGSFFQKNEAESEMIQLVSTAYLKVSFYCSFSHFGRS